jgi:hypothetical protein
MRIKDPVLVSKQVTSIYEVDVEGKKIEVSYWYNMDDEGKGGWDWDLSPCYEGLTDEEIEDLEEEFEIVIEDLGV